MMDLRDRLYVVLVSPRNPLNIGAVARAMANFGFSRLHLVHPYEVAFREARSAVGATHILAQASVCPAVADAVADCPLVVGTTSVGPRELRHPVRHLEYAARLIRKELASAPVALLFGSEKHGLSNEDMSHCHWLTRIPTVEEHGSMNLGQAVAVCLYELTRANASPSNIPKRPRRASSANLEMITTRLIEVLRESGYIQPRIAASTVQKIRRLVRRLDLSDRDAEVWLGILRQILWKLRSEGH